MATDSPTNSISETIATMLAKESDSLFEAISGAFIPTFVSVHSAEWKHAGGATCALFASNKDQLKGRGWAKFFDPESFAKLSVAIQNVSTGVKISQTVVVKCKVPGRADFSASCYLLRIKGCAVGFLLPGCSFTDDCPVHAKLFTTALSI